MPITAISGNIDSQVLNDNFSYLDTSKSGTDNLPWVDVTDYGAVGDGVTDDTSAIQTAIDNTPVGGTLIIKNLICAITSSLSITKKINIFGFGSTLKSIANGLNNSLDINGISGFSVNQLKFDQNLIGRTSIAVTNCSDFKILGCDFTGYSAQYGHSTYDGGICITDCSDYVIDKNFWHQHGYQYDATTATLNRCITIQGTTGDRARIINNNFYQVNQAIALNVGTNNLISGNTFEEVHDNTLYSLSGVKGVVVVDNVFNDKYDECLVISAGNVVVSGNKFRNSPNKFIAINGDIDTLNIGNNIFDNTSTTTGSFIAYRDLTHTITDLVITSNKFNHPSLTDTSAYGFWIGNVTNLIMKNNIVKLNAAANQKMVYFNGTSASGLIKDNYFEGTDSTSRAVEVDASVTSPDIIFEDNDMINCRAVFSGLIVRGHKIQTSAGPYILSKNERREAYMPSVPTGGTWSIGDVVINTAPTASTPTEKWLRVTNGTGNVLGTDWVAK